MKKINMAALLLVSCLSTTMYPSQKPNKQTKPASRQIEALVGMGIGLNSFMTVLSKCNDDNPLVLWEKEHNNEKEKCVLPNRLKLDFDYFSNDIRPIYNGIASHKLNGEEAIRKIQQILSEN